MCSHFFCLKSPRTQYKHGVKIIEFYSTLYFTLWIWITLTRTFVTGRMYGAVRCERSEPQPTTNFHHRDVILIRSALSLSFSSQKKRKCNAEVPEIATDYKQQHNSCLSAKNAICKAPSTPYCLICDGDFEWHSDFTDWDSSADIFRFCVFTLDDRGRVVRFPVEALEPLFL